MSLTELMPSTKNMLIAELQRQLTAVNTVLARGVHERDLDEAQPGSALWDARVHLGLDGATGARDIRSDGTGGGNRGLSPVPVVLAVDPGVQVEQKPVGPDAAAALIELVNQYGKAAHDYGLGDAGASDEMTDLWREINRAVYGRG